MKTTQTKPTKETILELLHKFTRQRAGLDFANYGDVKAYRQEQRDITRDLHNFRELAGYVGRMSITAEQLIDGFRAFSGRLTLNQGKKPSLEYCTGQYVPTEYRKAACAVLASAVWDYWRSSCMPKAKGKVSRGGFEFDAYPWKGRLISGGDWLRSNARAEFSRSVANGYFK